MQKENKKVGDLVSVCILLLEIGKTKKKCGSVWQSAREKAC